MDVQEVRENDEYTLDLGSNTVIHQVMFGNRGQLIGTYCLLRRLADNHNCPAAPPPLTMRLRHVKGIIGGGSS